MAKELLAFLQQVLEVMKEPKDLVPSEEALLEPLVGYLEALLVSKLAGEQELYYFGGLCHHQLGHNWML